MGDFDTRLTEIESGGAADAVVDSLLSLRTVPVAPDEPITLADCAHCGSPIGFYPPAVNAEVRPWHCRRCDFIHFAKADPSREKNYLGVAPLPPFANVVAAEAPRFPEVEDAPPPAHLLRLVKLLCDQDYRGIERRRFQRYTAVASVTAVPLDERFQVAGLPLRMTTVNLSHGGVALIHGERAVAAHYALDFSASGLALSQAIVEPVRMRALGPVYEIGARFVKGLARKAH